MGRGLLFPRGHPEDTWLHSVSPSQESFPSEPVIRLGFAPFLLKPSLSTAMKWEYIPHPQQELALPACAAGKKGRLCLLHSLGSWVFLPQFLKYILCWSVNSPAEEPWFSRKVQPLHVPLTMNFLLPQPSLFSHTQTGPKFLDVTLLLHLSINGHRICLQGNCVKHLPASPCQELPVPLTSPGISPHTLFFPAFSLSRGNFAGYTNTLYPGRDNK